MSKIIVEAGVKTGGFIRDVDRMKSKAAEFKQSIGAALSPSAIAGAVGVASVGTAIQGAIDKADKLQDLSERLGVSAQLMQVLGNAASVSGSSLDDVANAMRDIVKSSQDALADPRGDKAAAYKEMGISIERLASMKPDQIFMALSDSIAASTDKGYAMNTALDLMGKSGAALFGMMQGGSASITELGQSMGTWSNETISDLAEMKDRVTELGNNIMLVAGTVTTWVMDAVEPIMRFLAFASAAIPRMVSGIFNGDSFSDISKDLEDIVAAQDKAKPKATKKDFIPKDREDSKDAKAKEDANRAAQTKAEQDASKLSDAKARAADAEFRTLLGKASLEEKILMLQEKQAQYVRIMDLSNRESLEYQEARLRVAQMEGEITSAAKQKEAEDKKDNKAKGYTISASEDYQKGLSGYVSRSGNTSTNPVVSEVQRTNKLIERTNLLLVDRQSRDTGGLQ